jgi:SpoVK/Ycf46/Vps4 family AAA+-type ATPase
VEYGLLELKRKFWTHMFLYDTGFEGGDVWCDYVDVKIIAQRTHGFSSAYLANLVNVAALKAAINGWC